MAHRALPCPSLCRPIRLTAALQNTVWVVGSHPLGCCLLTFLRSTDGVAVSFFLLEAKGRVTWRGKEGKNQRWKEWIFKMSLPQLPLLCPASGNGQVPDSPQLFTPGDFQGGSWNTGLSWAGCSASDHRQSCSEEDGPQLISTNLVCPNSCLLLRDPDLAFLRAVYWKGSGLFCFCTLFPWHYPSSLRLTTFRAAEEPEPALGCREHGRKGCEHKLGDQEGACCMSWGDFSMIAD